MKLRTRIGRRIASALPSRVEMLVGSPAWGAAMALSMFAALGRANGWIDGHIPGLLAIYFIGAALAFSPAIFVARLLSDGRHAEPRFAAVFVCLSIATISFTALAYALQHLRYDIGWADLASGPLGLLFLALSFVGAGAEFAALGIRLYVPEGLAALVVASLWLARRRR